MSKGIWRYSRLLLLLLATATLLAVGAAGTAAAQDQVVSDDVAPGNSQPNCEAGPVTHNDIQDAVDAAAPGDTIVVCPGVYNESVTVDEDVRIVADKPGATNDSNRSVLRDQDGTNATAFEVVTDGVSIEGFSIDNFSTAAVRVNAAASDVSSLNVNRTVVQDSGAGVVLRADGQNVSGVTLEELALTRNDQGIRVRSIGGGVVSSIDVQSSGVNESTAPSVELVADNGTVSGVTLNGSVLNDSSTTALQGVATNGGTLADLEVTSSRIDNNTAGVDVVSSSGGTVESVRTSDLLVSNSSSSGIRLAAAGGSGPANVTITDTKVNRTANGPGVSVEADGASLSNVTLTEVELSTNRRGLDVATRNAGGVDDVTVDTVLVTNSSNDGVVFVADDASVAGVSFNGTVVNETDGTGLRFVASNGGTASDLSIETVRVSNNTAGVDLVAMGAGAIDGVNATEMQADTSTDSGLTVVARDAGSTVSNLSFQEVRVNETGSGPGMLFSGIDGGTVSDADVSTFNLEDNTNGLLVVATNGSVQSMSVNEALITGPGDSGLGLMATDGGTVSDVSVSEGILNDSDIGVSLNGRTGLISDVRFDLLDVGNTGGNTDAGVAVANGSASNFDNVTVTKSLIRNNGHGVLVNDSVDTDVTRSDINVSFNLIRDNGVGVMNENATTTVDARLNFWGDSTGPSSDASTPLQDPVFDVLADGSGDSVSAGQNDVSNVRFAPAIGGKRTCADDDQEVDPIGATGQSFETTVFNETISGSATDFVGACVWVRSFLPLRGTSGSAAQSILTIPTFIETDRGQLPINRQEMNVYERGREVNVTYESTTGANESRYANEDAQVLIVRPTTEGANESVDVNDLFTADFSPLSGDARFGSDNVEFVAVRNVTLDEDGTLPGGVQFTPAEGGTYMTVLTVNHLDGGFAVDANGNLTGNIHETDVSAIGFEALAVRTTNSSATPSKTSVQVGENVTFDLDAGFGNASTTFNHGLVLYNEDNFTDSTLVLDANTSFDVANLTIENGTVNATLTAPDGSKERVMLDVDTPFDIQGITSLDDVQDNVTVAGSFSLIDSTSKVGTGSRTTTTRLNTAGFENGTYRYIHVASTNDGQFSTDDGTIQVGCEPIPQAIDVDDNGLIDDDEILDAIDVYWRTDTPVPGACVGAIPSVEDDNPNNILTLIELWRTDTLVNGDGN